MDSTLTRLTIVIAAHLWFILSPWVALVIALSGKPLAGVYLVAIWVVSVIGPILSQKPLDGPAEFR